MSSKIWIGKGKRNQNKGNTSSTLVSIDSYFVSLKKMVWLFSISMSRLSHGDMIQNVSAANPCPDYYQATAIMSSTNQRLPKPLRRFVIRGRISQHLYEIDEKYWNKILCVFNSSYTVCTNECLTIIWEREFPLFLLIDVLESHSCTNFDDYDCLFFSCNYNDFQHREEMHDKRSTLLYQL